MAVPTINSAAVTFSNASAASKTFSYTVNAGTNTVLYVFVFNHSQGQATAVTFNADSLTKIHGSSDVHHYTIWRRVAPDVATGDIVVTYGAGNTIAGGAAIALDGVDQTTPEDVAVAHTTGTSADASHSITTVTNDSLIIGGSGHTGNALSGVGSGETQRWTVQHDTSSNYDSGSTKPKVTAGSETLTHTYGGSALWEMGLLAARSANPSVAVSSRSPSGGAAYGSPMMY